MTIDAVGTSGSAGSDHQDFEKALTPDVLSALMRSTWTWDDRALRRDLSALLVDVAGANGPIPDEAFAATLRARGLASAARFIGTVLGPKLITDTGNPFRDRFLGPATDPAQFDRMATAALAEVRNRAPDYLRSLSDAVDYPAESTWLSLAAEDAEGLGAAMRAYGHELSASPLFGNVGLAGQALALVGPEGADYLDRIQAGTVTATLAAAEKSGSWDPALVRTKAIPAEDGWVLTGTKQFVPAASDADMVFAIPRSTAGPSLFAVEASAPGLAVTDLSVSDSTRPLAQVDFAETPAELIGREGGGGRLMASVIDRATTALAAEQVGLIERAVSVLFAHGDDEAGSLAEVALDHAAALSLWRQALAESDAAAAAVAHIGCSVRCVRAANRVAELAGPSEETDAIMQRALSGSLLFGGPALSHERLLDRLGV